jgi:hypothetical protein
MEVLEPNWNDIVNKVSIIKNICQYLELPDFSKLLLCVKIPNAEQYKDIFIKKFNGYNYYLYNGSRIKHGLEITRRSETYYRHNRKVISVNESLVTIYEPDGSYTETSLNSNELRSVYNSVTKREKCKYKRGNVVIRAEYENNNIDGQNIIVIGETLCIRYFKSGVQDGEAVLYENSKLTHSAIYKNDEIISYEYVKNGILYKYPNDPPPCIATVQLYVKKNHIPQLDDQIGYTPFMIPDHFRSIIGSMFAYFWGSHIKYKFNGYQNPNKIAVEIISMRPLVVTVKIKRLLLRRGLSEYLYGTSEECVICYDNKPDCVIVPCLHNMFCRKCISKLHNCPMCRIKIIRKP